MNNEPVAWVDEIWVTRPDLVRTQNLDIGRLFMRSAEGVKNYIPLYTHPAKKQELLNEIEDLKLQNKYLKGCKPNIEIVAENEALKTKVKWYDDTFRLPTDTHPAKTLTDEEINVVAILQDAKIVPVGHEIWKTGEEFNKYKKIVLATAKALRKAQEK